MNKATFIEVAAYDCGYRAGKEEAQAEIDEARSILHSLYEKFLFKEETPFDLIQRTEDFIVKHKGKGK